LPTRAEVKNSVSYQGKNWLLTGSTLFGGVPAVGKRKRDMREKNYPKLPQIKVEQK